MNLLISLHMPVVLGLWLYEVTAKFLWHFVTEIHFTDDSYRNTHCSEGIKPYPFTVITQANSAWSVLCLLYQFQHAQFENHTQNYPSCTVLFKKVSVLYFAATLASEHAEKVVQHELRQQKLLKERQEAFGQAFQQDVQQFKLSGSLPSKYIPSLFCV
jgi:hypothetical protein